MPFQHICAFKQNIEATQSTLMKAGLVLTAAAMSTAMSFWSGCSDSMARKGYYYIILLEVLAAKKLGE